MCTQAQAPARGQETSAWQRADPEESSEGLEMTQRGAATALLGFKNTQVGVGTPARPWWSPACTFLPSADKVSEVSANLSSGMSEDASIQAHCLLWCEE